MLPIKFQSIWLSSFRKDFFEINQVKTRIACGGHVCERMGDEIAIFLEDLSYLLPTKLGSFGHAVSEEKIFLENDRSETRIACGGHIY
jgi:hypothetical protein